jgi:hypothetical protein
VLNGLAARLVAAVVAQDGTALAECFAPAAELRALTPPGLRERTGANEASALISRWFGESTELQLLDSDCAPVGDRLHLWYRVTGVEEGAAYVVEQHLFCTIDNGKIERADLLCSGFRPPTAATA